MYLHKTKNGHYTPPCCYFSGELEVVEILRFGFCCKFSTSLGDVLGYIKYSKDKKALSKFLNDNQVMIMDNDAARVIRDVTNTPIYVPDGKGEIDMCKAVRDMIDESKQEGMAAGELNKAKKMALKMYKKGDSIEEIAEMAEVSVDQVKEWINSAV